MAKVSEKETATNIIQKYQSERIRSPKELESLIGLIACTNGCEILRIQLLDTSDRYSEGSASGEIEIEEAKKVLADKIKQHRADSISMLVDYCGTHIVLGVDLQKWIISIAEKKSRDIKLDAFAKAINL